MRKLAWFSGGFALCCLLCCYGPAGLYRPLLPAFAGGALALRLLCLQLARRPRPAERLPAALRRGLALLLGGALAAGWFWGWTALFRAPADRLAGQTLTLSGTVSSYPAATSIGGCSLTVGLDGGFAAPDVLVYTGAEWADLAPGDHVTFTARLEPSTLMRGDETTYYTAKGVFLLGYCDEAPLTVSRPDVPAPAHWPAHFSRALRGSLTAAYDSHAAPLAAALATGDKSLLSDAVSSDLNRAGISHAVVVSGMHVSCLVALAMAFTKNRRRLAFFVLPLLVFYALMAGGTPSAFRAVVMQGVFLAAPLARREQDSPTALGLALLVLLLANPYAAGSVSLQLSFSSVAGILAATPPLLARWNLALKSIRSRHSGRLWGLWLSLARGMAASAATSLGALVFTQPLLTLYFSQASLVFLLTNLLVLWAVVLFLPCALTVGLLGLFLPGPARALGLVTGLLARYVLAVASLLGRWRFAAVDTANPYFLLCLAAVYLFLAAGLLLHRHPLRPAVPLCCLAVLLAAAFGFTRLPMSRAVLTVTALDVGQGSSTAFLSGGRACLVDCGGSGPDSAGDTAADYFAGLGISRLDLLVLTHFDDDHVSGVAELFHRMEVREVALPQTETSAGQLSALLPLIQAEGAAVRYVSEIVQLPFGSGTITLYPPLGKGTSNEEGLFFLCSAGDFDALVTGDADSFVEKMLIKYYNIPDVELLAAGHHGSAGSTSDALLDGARPELALISAGKNNRYGHPSAAALGRLAAHGARVYRTDTMGTITIYVRSDGYAAQTQG